MQQNKKIGGLEYKQMSTTSIICNVTISNLPFITLREINDIN